MPKLGDTKQAREVGRKGNAKYIWAECGVCKKARWVLLHGGRVETKRCRDCFRLAQRREVPIEERLKFLQWVDKRRQTKGWRRWDNLRNGAIRRGLDYLTFVDFQLWYSQQDPNCYYCGITLQEGHKKLDTETIDRKSNSIGYLLNNIVLACRKCNMIKGSWFTAGEMLGIAKKYIAPKLKPK